MSDSTQPKTVKRIMTDDLRRMEGQEGLILQGCGGDPQEWVDGVNDLFTEEGILLNGSAFKAENVSLFQHGELTNMLFPFEGVELAVGKLAIWRIQTHGQFGGTWLSDYVPNKLGGFAQEKPKPAKPFMKLLGEDGNIFSIMGRASRLLLRAGMEEQSKEMVERVTTCGDYYQALNIISEYWGPHKTVSQVLWGEEEQGSERSFPCQRETELSGLCDDEDTELSDHSQPQKSTKKKGKDAHER